MGVISAHRPRPPIVVAGQTLVKAGLRPPPPAASALTRVWPATFCAAKVSTGRSGPRADPHAPPVARHHANFLLDKKDPIQGRVRGPGDWPRGAGPKRSSTRKRIPENYSRSNKYRF